MSPRHLLLGTGLALSLWLVLFGDRTPINDLAQPVTPIGSQRGGNDLPTSSDEAPRHTHAYHEPAILALQVRETLIGGAEVEQQHGGIFGSQSWTPPPLPIKPSPTPPPTAPALPFTYLGKKVEENQWEVYLARGDQTIIARPQTVIDGTYRIDTIQPPILSLTYLPLKQVQTLSIGAVD